MGTLGLEDGVELVDLVYDCDAVATVGVLPWFDDPDVTHFALLLYAQLHLFLLFLDVGLALFVIGQESLVLWVLDAFLDMERQGDSLEQITAG